MNQPSNAIQTDPILTAIAEYRHAWQAFVTAPDESEDEFWQLCKKPRDVLCNWNDPVRTQAGALAALALAIEEDETGGSPFIGPMMRAAFKFFDGGAVAQFPGN